MYDQKKIVERQRIERFRQLWNEFPKGKLIASESPDFIIKPNRKTSIGIELTSFYPPGFFNVETHATDQENLEEALLELIRQKEDKLLLYQKQHLQQLWLLVTVEPEIFGPAFRLNMRYLSRVTLRKFDRIFVLILPDTLFDLSNDAKIP